MSTYLDSKEHWQHLASERSKRIVELTAEVERLLAILKDTPHIGSLCAECFEEELKDNQVRIQAWLDRRSEALKEAEGE